MTLMVILSAGSDILAGLHVFAEYKYKSIIHNSGEPLYVFFFNNNSYFERKQF
jgi:hypothetical protein